MILAISTQEGRTWSWIWGKGYRRRHPPVTARVWYCVTEIFWFKIKSWIMVTNVSVSKSTVYEGTHTPGSQRSAHWLGVEAACLCVLLTSDQSFCFPLAMHLSLHLCLLQQIHHCLHPLVSLYWLGSCGILRAFSSLPMFTVCICTVTVLYKQKLKP